MNSKVNYNRIAEAINYISANFKNQPDLDEVARQVHLSPYHFQRLFTEWAGVSPKKFLQYTTISYAKSLLKGKQATLFDTAYATGLSGTGRLHDLFVKIEAMTPGDYKNGGALLEIHFQFSTSIFGEVLIAATSKGICHLSFHNDKKVALDNLKKRFPKAIYVQKTNHVLQKALAFFVDQDSNEKLNLHLKGTDFQLKVWEALLKIPQGDLSTYANISKDIGNPGASRAVGSAIGKNPVAFLIPCHRVIQSSGRHGGYMWGSARKTIILGWEAACMEKKGAAK